MADVYFIEAESDDDVLWRLVDSGTTATVVGSVLSIQDDGTLFWYTPPDSPDVIPSVGPNRSFLLIYDDVDVPFWFTD